MYYKDLPSEKVYFVNKGFVVMTWDEFQEIPVAVYEKGMWFGDFEVYKNVSRLFSCVTLTDVELFALSKRDFRRIFFGTFTDFGNYFLHKMDENFENLENTMEIVYQLMFPASFQRTVDSKLGVIKNQRKIISQISEIKQSALQSKESLPVINLEGVQNGKKQNKNLKKNFQMISHRENENISSATTNMRFFDSNRTTDQLTQSQEKKGADSEDIDLLGSSIKNSPDKSKFSKKVEPTNKKNLYNQTSLEDRSSKKERLFKIDKSIENESISSKIKIPKTKSMFQKPKEVFKVLDQKPRQTNISNVSIDEQVQLETNPKKVSFRNMDSQLFKDKFSSKENFLESKKATSGELNSEASNNQCKKAKSRNGSLQKLRNRRSSTNAVQVAQKRDQLRKMMGVLLSRVDKLDVNLRLK